MNATEQQAFDFLSAGTRPSAARGNQVIEAGAGTGKTTAIVGEVLQLLLGRDAIAPERIVLVTFTEKAAGEIADRIHSALEEIAAGAKRWPASSHRPAYEAPPIARERAVQQLARIDSLRSQTIHSFCQSLLRQYPIEAKIDPQFRIIEGFERSLVYDEIFDDWVDHETRVDSSSTAEREWEALLDRRTYFFLAKSDIYTLLDKRHLLLDDTYTIGGIAEYEKTLTEAVAKIRPRDEPPPPPGSSIDDWIEYFAPVAPTLRAIKLPGEKRDKNALKVLREAYDLLVSHRAAEAALSLTRSFIAYLDAEKRMRGVLDFDDLLLRTRALLHEPSVLDRVRDQFDFIFVDEFQDTDRIQAEILQLLATDSSGRFAPGKITVVGDPKQSIYAFRRADPETYARFTRSVLPSNEAPRLLVDQYRSAPSVVEALNEICPKLFESADIDPNVFQPKYNALSAARAPGEAGAPFKFIDGGDDAEKEAEAIVAWIRSQNHEDLRRFALLFRRKTKIDDYLDVFDRHNLPYVIPPLGLFLDRPAAVDLLAVLRAVAYAFDRGAQISAARSPYFALTDAEIATGILNDAAGPWKEFRNAMDALRDTSRHVTVTQLIDHVVLTCGIEAIYGDDSPRALRHLEQVRTIAFAYDQKTGGSVRQFVEEIARRRDAPEEVEPSLLDETTNAVRILTIHGAKGLEFETVLLPDLEFQSSGKGIDLFTVEEPRSLVIRNGLETLSGSCRFSELRPLKEIGSLRDKAETRRLFYVAITRAKSEVVFVTRPEVTNHGFGRFVRELFPGQLPVAGSPLPEKADRQPVTGNGQTEIEPCIVPTPEPIVPLLTREEIAIARRGSPNRAAGILLHRVLERWDGASDVAPLIASLASELGADDLAIDRVRKRIGQVASSPVFERILAAETIGREMPVAFIDDSGVLLERRIDRLIREDGTDTVIDYKSGEPGDARVERDREQVSLYCRVVAQMTGRPCRGLLWYIDADNDVAIDVM